METSKLDKVYRIHWSCPKTKCSGQSEGLFDYYTAKKLADKMQVESNGRLIYVVHNAMYS